MCSLRSYCALSIVGILSVCYLWKLGTHLARPSRESSLSSIRLDMPASTSFSNTNRYRPRNESIIDGPWERYDRERHRDTVPKYMLWLYHRRPEVDIVRAFKPLHVSRPTEDGGRIMDFSVPLIDSEETLETAELLATAGTILRVRSLEGGSNGGGDGGQEKERKVSRSRREDAWRAFDVTGVVATRRDRFVRIRVYGRSVKHRPWKDEPILLLSYKKRERSGKRHRRSTLPRENEGNGNNVLRWEDDGARRRRKNSCRRRPLYVDFALIAYDEWVVAPPGYEAYQCTGKCYYPFGDHLSPTKHAIVQTLVHSAVHGNEDSAGGNKLVGRACCVPTQLGPTSLLYLDASGTLTYQYGYEDMVVIECGCR